jgi:ABC-type multidrug transport system fused ATPase/permease subunit
MNIFKILLSFLGEYKLTIIVYIICTILAFPLESIVVPQIYSHFFEILNSKTKIDVFIKYFIIITVILLVVNISNSTTTYIESYMIPNLNEYVINYIFKNLLYKYENSYGDIELGKIIMRINTIPQYLKSVVTDFCIWIFPRTLAIIAINIYFFVLSWKLGLVSIILVFLFFIINYYCFNVCLPYSNERHILFEKKNQDTQDKLSNSYSIYSTGSLNKEIFNYEKNTNIYTSKFKENLYCLFKATTFTSLLIVLLFVFLNSTAVYLFMKKELSFTNLIAVFITIIYYTPCIITINSTVPDLAQYYGALTAVDSFMEELYKINMNNKNIKRNDKKILLNIDKGNIIINNLTFGYKNNENIFNNFYLTIKENEKIAIIGESGNGKSTLIKLIMGYYKVNNDMIYIDNTDINNYSLNDLRKQISYVNQNNKLFNMSIMENIQYGNNVSRDEIINLCYEIKVDNIFKNLKNSYDTIAGIEGNNLSGGQRQIIHILRCICQKNKIVILDEPTSAMDKSNTINVINAIKKLSKNSTLILITHDDNILSLVNRIITIDAGKIIDDVYTNNKVKP